MMPALTGSELANVLRRRTSNTRVILHSSKTAPELDALVRETGALGAIPKGLEDRHFRNEIFSLVRRALSVRLELAGDGS
jgi:DNA-binding response OmpR family regulator